MPDKKPWYAPLIEKWSGKLLHLFSLGAIAYLGIGDFTDEGQKPTGGNLDNFINGDYTSYKEWVSSELNDVKKRIRANENHINQEIGAERERENSPANQFLPEYHYGITLKRNVITKELFYDHPSEGRRHAYIYNDTKKVAYLSNDGKWYYLN